MKSTNTLIKIKSRIFTLAKKFLRAIFKKRDTTESLPLVTDITLKSTISICNSEKRMMMVLWPFIAVGGAEGIALNILKNPMISKHFDYVNVCLYEPSESLGDLSGAFEEISCAFYKSENFQDSNTTLNCINYLIEKHKIEVLFVPSGTTFFYDFVISIKRRFPELRIVNQVYDHKEGWIQHYNSEKSSVIDYHVAPNYLIKKAYMNHGVSDNNSPLIYHGIQLDCFEREKYLSINLEQQKSELKIPEGKLIVTFAARMHPQKRPFDFLKIAQKLSEHKQFHFLIVGDGELSQKIEEEIKNLNLENITKLGFQRPIQKVYLCTDIVVITSEYEGLPLVLLEALSMNIPAVSTPVGAIPEVINPNLNGLLVEKVGDIDTFCESIINVANNIETFKRNCKDSRNGLYDLFSVETMCKKYLDVFTGKI